MPRLLQQGSDLSEAEVEALIQARQAPQPALGGGQELSEADVEAIIQGRSAGSTGGQKPPGPLQTIGGTLLDVGANVAQFGEMMAKQREDYMRAHADPSSMLHPDSRPQYRAEPDAPWYMQPTGGSASLRAKAQEVYPKEIRGTGSFWGEEIPAALTRTGATVAAGLIGGPSAAILTSASDRGVAGYNEALQETGGDEAKAKTAMAGQMGLGVLDAVLGAGASGHAARLGKELTERGLVQVGKTMLKTLATEVPQELVDQGVSDAMMETLTGKDREIWKNMVDTLGPSTVVALFFGGARGLAEGRTGTGTAPPDETADLGDGVKVSLHRTEENKAALAAEDAQAAQPHGGVERRKPSSAQEVLDRVLTQTMRLHKETETDPKFGVLNARGDERVSNLVIDETRKNPGHRAVRFVLDNRDQTSMNALLGHEGADAVIHDYIAGWQQGARKGDAWSRIGGDEFAATLMLPPDVDPQAIAERLEAGANAALRKHGIDKPVRGRVFGVDAGWAEVDLNPENKFALQEATKAADAMSSKLKRERNPSKRKPEGAELAQLQELGPAEREARLKEIAAEDAAAQGSFPAEEPAKGSGAIPSQEAGPLQPDQLDEQQMAPDRAPTPEPPRKTTGIKNATVEKELAEMGLPPPVKGEPKPDIELHRRAKERFESKDRPAEKLLDSLEGKPRPVSDEDNALLTFEANRLIQERKAAQEAFNKDPSEENGAAVNKAQAAYARAADIFDAIGTEGGRSLRARRLMLNEDYSLAQMERELQVSKGGEALTKQERADLAKISEELEAATKRATDAETKVAALEAERALAKLKKEAAKLPAEKAPKPPRRSAIEKTKQEIEDIYRRMGERAKNRVHSGAGFGPDDIPDLVLLAGKHIKLGVQTFDAWAAEVVSRLGEGVRPHLRAAWNEAEKKKGESRLKARRTRLSNEIKELERRIAEKDFTEKEKKPLRADPEAVRLKAEVEGVKRRYRGMKRRAERAARTRSEKLKAALREVGQAPREVAPNFDFSAVMTQGAVFAMGQPIKTVRQMGRMFNAFATERRALRELERLKAHPLYETAKAAKLPMMEWDSELSDGETHMASWIAKKVPGIRRFNRAFATFINVQRHEKFYDMVRSNWDEKRPPTQKELKDTARDIGVMSGRGSLGKANAAMDALAVPFFSPRKVIGNIEAAVGSPLLTGSYRKRKAFAKQYARTAVGFSALVSLALMAGEAYGVDVEVGDDPRDPNFGKIKWGEKWYDPWGGLSQAFVFLWRQGSGEKKGADGKVTKLRGSEAGYKAGLMTTADFLRSKASPVVGFGLDALWGKDWLDRDITPLESAKEHFIPMTPHDFYKALRDEGFSEAAAETFVNMFGIRVRDYARGSR